MTIADIEGKETKALSTEELLFLLDHLKAINAPAVAVNSVFAVYRSKVKAPAFFSDAGYVYADDLA